MCQHSEEVTSRFLCDLLKATVNRSKALKAVLGLMSPGTIDHFRFPRRYRNSKCCCGWPFSMPFFWKFSFEAQVPFLIFPHWCEFILVWSAVAYAERKNKTHFAPVFLDLHGGPAWTPRFRSQIIQISKALVGQLEWSPSCSGVEFCSAFSILDPCLSADGEHTINGKQASP